MNRTNYWERFFGFTLNINPVFNLIGLLVISIIKRERFKYVKKDKMNLYFWLILAISGTISILLAYNTTKAIIAFSFPFAFIWLYILGKYYIDDPGRFLKDVIRGTVFLGFISILATIFNIELVINDFEIITDFANNGRGYIFGIGDNGLGIIFQAGIVGALGFLVLNIDKKYRFIYVIYLIISTWGLIITRSRGAMVGVLGGVLILALVLSWKILLLFSGGSVLAIIGSDRLMNRVQSIFEMENHLNRIRIYKGTWNMIKEHFWFGVGPGNFSEIKEQYELLVEAGHRTPHSNYFNIITGWGIIGGILFFGWVFYIIIKNWLKGMNNLQKIIVAILIAFWVHVIFNDLITAYSAVLLGCLDNPRFKKNNS